MPIWLSINIKQFISFSHLVSGRQKCPFMIWSSPFHCNEIIIFVLTCLKISEIYLWLKFKKRDRYTDLWSLFRISYSSQNTPQFRGQLPKYTPIAWRPPKTPNLPPIEVIYPLRIYVCNKIWVSWLYHKSIPFLRWLFCTFHQNLPQNQLFFSIFFSTA